MVTVTLCCPLAVVAALSTAIRWPPTATSDTMQESTASPPKLRPIDPVVLNLCVSAARRSGVTTATVG